MSKIVRLHCRAHVDEQVCTNIAKAVILTEMDEGPFSTIEAYPLCADHAPEEVHEVASSMDESEFLVVELPAFGVGDLT